VILEKENVEQKKGRFVLFIKERTTMRKFERSPLAS
jgi:hypothetical protein